MTGTFLAATFGMVVAFVTGVAASPATAAVVTPVATPAVAAPQMSKDVVVVDVPFDFVAGDETLPAGTYRVTVMPDQHPLFVTLQTAASAHMKNMEFQTLQTRTVPVKELKTNDGQPSLVFAKVGDHYFLRTIKVVR